MEIELDEDDYGYLYEDIVHVFDEYIDSNEIVNWEDIVGDDLVKIIDHVVECYPIFDIRELVDDIVLSLIDIYFDDETGELVITDNAHFIDTVDYSLAIPRSIIPLKTKIEQLKQANQTEQRTAEWYEHRHGLLTASSIWKTLKSEATKNSIIYEKCQPYREKNISSASMEWGKMFEPVSIQLYESYHDTKVGEFGCIAHPRYPFIGASPDGINILESSPLFGRMVEVKNIVNREITGIPKYEYYVQMQMQMEVCDLDECDFIETRFKEMDELEYGVCQDMKGIILIGYFANDYTPHYRYDDRAPNAEYIGQWLSDNGYSYHKILYWRLDQYSCVLVMRDKEWFERSLPEMERIWNIIQTERMTGYEHRKPKSRAKKEGCLFVDDDDEAKMEDKKSGQIKVVKLG